MDSEVTLRLFLPKIWIGPREVHKIGGHHNHSGAVVFCAYLGDHLHTPQFQSGRVSHHQLSGVSKFLRCLQFSVRFDDSGSLFTHCFRFHRHYALHFLGDLNILHFEQFDSYAPGAGVLKHISLKQGIYLVALLEDLVEIVLSNHVTETRQCHLLHGRAEALNSENSFWGVTDSKPEHRVYLHGHAIASDGFLLLDGVGNDAQIDTSFVFDPQRNQPEQPWSAQAVVAAQPKYDGTLVLPGNPET